MAKKNFSGGLGSLLGDQPQKPKVGRPKTQKKKVTKTSEEGTLADETRATFIVNKSDLEKLKAIAYWDRMRIKDVMAQMLKDRIAKYEKKNGKVKIPKR